MIPVANARISLHDRLEVVKAELQAHIACYALWYDDREAWWQRGEALIKLRDKLSSEVQPEPARHKRHGATQ